MEMPITAAATANIVQTNAMIPINASYARMDFLLARTMPNPPVRHIRNAPMLKKAKVPAAKMAKPLLFAKAANGKIGHVLRPAKEPTMVK